MIVLAVVNLKGGSTKTTTSAFMAHALHESGLRTLGVDADAENESLLSWQETAEWPIPVVGMPVANLHQQLPGVVGSQYEAVVIDTPPVQERRGIVLSALRLATHVVCPLAPTGMEYQRLSAVRQLMADAAELRDDRPVFAVLLTRTVAGAASTGVYRDLIAEDGVHVLRATVGRLERFAQAYGQSITNAAASAYGDAVTELLGMEVSA